MTLQLASRLIVTRRYLNRCRYGSTKNPRKDPTASRPNKLCDPYDQGGRPMPAAQIQSLRSTISKEWMVEDDCALVRAFRHPDFLSGARFLQKVAAVAEMNAHFPLMQLDRTITKRAWIVESTIRCHTKVLQGLSTHDFHLAMVRN